jgi:hypothetical protein
MVDYLEFGYGAYSDIKRPAQMNQRLNKDEGHRNK